MNFIVKSLLRLVEIEMRLQKFLTVKSLLIFSYMPAFNFSSHVTTKTLLDNFRFNKEVKIRHFK